MVETGLAPVYRYYTADLLTNEILAEIPFRGVSYERTVKGAGSFSGSIPVIEATKSMNIYESTMPGNTALYVVRNGVCVWGGIIWTRSYDVVGRVLNVTGAEFTSYLYHRRFWKTWGHDYGATVTVASGEIYVQLDNGSASNSIQSGASIRLAFDSTENTKYDGVYTIADTPSPTNSTFGVNNSQTVATVNYISRTTGIVTAITDTAHTLSVNDQIELDLGVDSEFTGTHIVLSVGGSENTVFTFHLEGGDIAETEVSGTVTRPIADGIYPLTTVSVRLDTYDFVRSMLDSVFSDFVSIDFPNTYIEPGISYNYEIIQKEVEEGVATLKTAEPHNLAAGQAVQVKNVDPLFDGEFYVTETRAVDEFSYELGGYVPVTPVTVNAQNIERLSAVDGVVIVTTLEPHGFLVGQSVIIETGTTEGGTADMLNGVFTITEIVSEYIFKYASGYMLTIPEIIYDPATASSESRRNLVENPSFEVNLTSWSSEATLTRDTTQHRTGVASGKVVSTALAQKTSTAYFTVSGSTTYTASVYVKGEVDKYVSLDLETGAVSSGTSGNIRMTGDWQRISAKVTTAAGETSLQLVIRNQTSGSHTFYLDDALLEKTVDLKDYFDGASTDTLTHTYAWSGTAHASQSVETHNIDIILASISGNTVTLTSTEPPDFFLGNSVAISGVNPQLSIVEKSYNAIDGEATVQTSSDHNLQVGDTVDITGLRDYSSLNARVVSGTQVTLHTNLSHNIFIGDVVTISDMKDVYTVTSKKINGNVATITVSAAHNIAAGDEITVSNIYDSYSINNKILSNGVATLTLDVPVGGGHNILVNDSVSIAGVVDVSDVISKTTENGIAVLTTDYPHNFLENDDITVAGLGAPFDGDFKVLSFTDTRVSYSIEAEIVDQIPLTAANGTISGKRGTFNGDYVITAVTANTISFNRTANDVLTSAVTGASVAVASILNGTYTVSATPAVNKFSYAMTAYNVAETAVTAATDEAGFAPQASVDSIHLGDRTVTSVTRNTFTFTQSGISNSVALQNISGTVSVDSIFNGTSIPIIAKTADTFTYLLTAPNNILETPANSLAFVTAPNIYNGTFTLTAVSPDLNTISYSKSHVDMVGTSIQGYGSATVDPKAIVSTFGPFPGNSNIGVEYSTLAYSGKTVSPIPYRGFELTNVGEALSKYSDSIDGFEYRIDCSYDSAINQFRKTFILIPIDFPNPPAAGEISPISRFGADKIVFEYPGNIINLDIEESAENAATRFFAVGENDLGPDAGPPFSVASSNGLLRGVDSARKWPLLDDDEKVPDIDDEMILYSYAERYLAEARPPDAKLGVSVNGSLQPLVGSYAPGDWCSLIVDDEYILERLRSGLEPRDNIILRKIDVVKVSVPDGTTFPEKVDLTLVPEWEVDKRG